jgi:hypothetical protein
MGGEFMGTFETFVLLVPLLAILVVCHKTPGKVG